MRYLATLQRQHEEIHELVNNVKEAIIGGNLEAEANQVALWINTLAGKLKIHLGTEDKYMYPEMLQSEKKEIRDTAKTYIEEMGNISDEFIQFKDRFNTRSKITADIKNFISESDRVFKALGTRMLKEEKSLYTTF